MAAMEAHFNINAGSVEILDIPSTVKAVFILVNRELKSKTKHHRRSPCGAVVFSRRNGTTVAGPLHDAGERSLSFHSRIAPLGMDLDDFRSILETAGVDVWMFIDTAIDVASMDYGKELKHRRDGIVQRLFGATSDPTRCRNCEEISAPIKKQSTPKLKLGASPTTPHSIRQDDDDLDPYGGLLDDE
ncbi:putative mediator of RNA polymerase II transcription subunit 26c [Senna tora]|uniref:Putative mediator of RNA polymerase II transcription subunit 26c n=1 Tax=Senna tora TaxID=362788 RepID=A0A834SQN0_9FABA|nr:putative mediator of RNA polymerase II transcription subunit 26c [Senna tora]